MKKPLFLLTALAISVGAQSQISFSNATNLIGTQGLTTSHPIGILDVNNDDKDDLIILAGGSEMYIEMQGASGQPFTEYASGQFHGTGAWGMCGADVDEDGYADMIYGGWYDDVYLMTTNTVGSSYNFGGISANLFVQGINTADIDNDGNLDIFICHDDGPSQIWLGDGNGNFAINTSIINTSLYGGGEDDAGNYGSVWTDIDNDGDIDLYIAKCRQGVSDSTDVRRINQLFINNGNGTYTEMAASWNLASGEQSWMADFGDIDNDGDMDLLMGQHTNEYVEIYENNGNGTFTDITASAGLAGSFPVHVIQGKFEDFDNDGYIDILISGVNNYMFAMNNGDGTFDYSSQPVIGCEVNSFATGDLNHDGFTDFYATPHGYGAWNPSTDDSLYFNDGNANNHLTVSLTGIFSNPDAVGARVAIYGPWGVQLREVRSGESYGIQNTLNCHFGLGTETMVDSVVINWPSGIVDTYSGVPAGFVHFDENVPFGLDEPTNGLSLNVYPNPADQKLVIDLGDLSREEIESISLLDASGRMLPVRYLQNGNLMTVDRGNLQSGLYLVQVQTRDGLTLHETVIFR